MEEKIKDKIKEKKKNQNNPPIKRKRKTVVNIVIKPRKCKAI